jgi:hypothetical protein
MKQIVFKTRLKITFTGLTRFTIVYQIVGETENQSTCLKSLQYATAPAKKSCQLLPYGR